uniref:EF-hand domain-containing protein n=1 Tax=Cyclophora tenuis TaxID=216820 RepID=A0A7S1GHV2_CYCTE|mmetsp:Transcript_13234/g.22516  ORF Transcript_13234/g.22516 Transcript_13234/m.22516 type:complete len:251 (+) Transcript_13234:2-754(+)
MFDTDSDGGVDFSEVAIGLFQLTHDMTEASKLAVSVLLMMDKKSECRELDYEAFSKLIVSIVTASGKTFHQMADAMTMAMTKAAFVSSQDLEQLMASEEAYEQALRHQHAEDNFEEVMDALQYNRLQKLFDLWDTDQDESIDYEELVNGLRKFQTVSKSVDETAQDAATILAGFDADKNQTLNRIEFATSLVSYAKEAEVELTELVDFLVVASVMEENSDEEKAYIRSIAVQANENLREVADLLERHGIE